VDYERALVGTAFFIESEMALFSERSLECASKLLDTADIVRDAMFRQQYPRRQRPQTTTAHHYVTHFTDITGSCVSHC
jgi:hypothetical protein